MPGADIATGITLAFGTSGFAAEIVDLNAVDQTREEVNTSHQGTVGAHTYAPVDLIENGNLVFDIHYDPALDPPIDGPVEEITQTWPDGTTHVFDAFMTGITGVAPLNGKMTGQVTLKVSGPIVKDPQGVGSGSGSFT